MIEVWCPSECAPSAELGWTPVSLQNLHDPGLNAPSENMAQAILEGTAGPQGEVDACNYRSYARCQRVYDRWQVILGSETWRSLTTPGTLRTRGYSYKNEVCYFDFLTRFEWGWRSYVQAPPQFVAQGFQWRQRGAHWFNKVLDPYASEW